MTTIYLVRHGEVENPEQVFYGRMPGFPLSSSGKERVENTANYLAKCPLAGVFSSPLLRARQTAQQIASKHDLEIQTTPLLNEVYVPYDGWLLSKLEDMDWNIYENLEKPYEQPEDVLSRALQFLKMVHDQYPSQEVVAVSHGDVILVTHMLWGKQLLYSNQNKKDFRPYPNYGSITELRLNDSGLQAINYQEM